MASAVWKNHMIFGASGIECPLIGMCTLEPRIHCNDQINYHYIVTNSLIN